MCGIVGYWGSPSIDARSSALMCDALRHRGPDSAGLYFGDAGQLMLGHRRLSILELSEAGNQPFVSECGRYAIIFNGEIYNHNDLRRQLSSCAKKLNWVGKSDTETLMSCLIYFGIDETLSKISGMYSFAFWDEELKTLDIVRDPMGEKPLYYGHNNNIFIFSSELKALTQVNLFKFELDEGAVSLFLKYGYIPGEKCIYKNMKKLLPGHRVTITDSGKSISEVKKYSKILNDFGSEISIMDQNEDKYIAQADAVLTRSVEEKMLSDRPIGAFLSGGIDSSLIVALMQKTSNRKIRTFSIGFKEPGFNEASYARDVAEHLGTNHTEFILSSSDAQSVIPMLPEIYDEPFADSSQIPTYLVSKLAKNDVDVCLSGDGGDELFAGYTRYSVGYNAWRYTSAIPSILKRLLFSDFTARELRKNNFISKSLSNFIGVTHISDKLDKIKVLSAANSPEDFYQTLISTIQSPNEILNNPSRIDEGLNNFQVSPDLDFITQMMLMDLHVYLPDDILTKVDRASMAVSLEVRVPFLDPNVVKFAGQVPLSLKIKHHKGKYLLRKLLQNYVPQNLFERPKMGFGVPIGDWLIDPLRDWAEDLLSEERLLEVGIFDVENVRRMWDDLVTGKVTNHYKLWNLLMFQAWHIHQKHLRPN